MPKYSILASSFLGKPIQKNQQYLIVGGGIAGLLMGYCLKKSKIPFKIIEQQAKIGGILGSQQLSLGLVEQAANGFLWSAEMQALCDELKLEILGPKASAKARYLVRDKQLRKFPLNFMETIAGLPKIWASPSQKMETIYDFGLHYFGKAMTNQVLEPAFAGIYGADIKKLSFPGALTPLAKFLNHSDNLLYGWWKQRGLEKKQPKNTQTPKKRGTHSFKNGMSDLVEGLQQYLSSEIEYEQNGLDWKDSSENLILCTPAPITKDFFPQEERMFQLLNQVEYTPIISISLIFPKAALKHFKAGFGCLIPRKEGLRILGTLFNSCIFDHRVQQEEHLSLTCIIRDDSKEKSYFQQSPEFIKDWVVKELNSLFDIQSQPLEFIVFKWEKGIPLYSPDLYNSWFEMNRLLKENYPQRNLFGNYTGEISIRGMCQTVSHLIS